MVEVNFYPIMKSQTLEFIKYLVGIRAAKTTDTENEMQLLSMLAKGKKCIVEVGVFEGVASQIFCQSMDKNGKLYLVDPYFYLLKMEKILKISTTEIIAKRTLKPWMSQVQFVRQTSVSAASCLQLEGQADLIFIDALHDYDSVLEDFKCWTPMLSDDGVMAFHDSRICEARQDLNDQVGSVRLCNEIARGEHGDWQVVHAVDSITAITRSKSRKKDENLVTE